MTVLPITYKTKTTGPTDAEVNEVLVDRFVWAVLADQKYTPDEYRGQGRNGETPFKRTGALVEGLFFKRASAGGRKAGLIGSIRAPAARFGTAQVRDKFLDRYLLVERSRGVAWSIGQHAEAKATLDKLTGMTRSQRDALLAGGGR